MGMFDSLFDKDGNEWQTKALGRSMSRYAIDDPVKLLLKDCQIEVIGGPSDGSVWRYATVRGGILTQVPDYRRPELPLVSYCGDLVEDEVPTISVVRTAEELRAIPGDDLVINGAGHIWQRTRGEDWWRGIHSSSTTSTGLVGSGPFFRVRSSARLMDAETLAGEMYEAWRTAGDTAAWVGVFGELREAWVDHANVVVVAFDLT